MKIRHLLIGAALALFAAVPMASAGSFDHSKKLRRAVTLEGILEHERKLQRIADAHQGNRAAATMGYDASAEYVADKLDDAGYRVRFKPFDFPTWRENSTPVLEQTSPTRSATCRERRPMTTTPRSTSSPSCSRGRATSRRR